MAREVALRFKPQFDKIVELMLHLATNYPDLSKYQVVKIFYFADKMHIERYGRPLSFDTYYALWYGPVASNAMDLMEEDEYTLRLAGIKELPFEISVRPDEKGRAISYLGRAKREVNLEVLSESDTEILDEVASIHKDDSFEALMRETHDHRAYKLAWRERGDTKRALIDYADMIEDDQRRLLLVEDISPVASNLQ